jgi:predicted amidophosphoribosyltransferase
MVDQGVIRFWYCWACLAKINSETSPYCSRCEPEERMCVNCNRPLDQNDMSGFCSAKCEDDYGKCRKCGGPLRGGGVCYSCREP